MKDKSYTLPLMNGVRIMHYTRQNGTTRLTPKQAKRVRLHDNRALGIGRRKRQ